MPRSPSPVSRIAWIDRTVAQPVDELGRYLRDGLRLPASHPGVRSYLELLDEAGPAARQHETFIALQIDARRAAGAIRRAGGREAGAVAVLLRELAASSYAVYVIHIFPVVGLQLALAPAPLPPLANFALVTLAALPLCFALASGLRRLPGAGRVL